MCLTFKTNKCVFKNMNSNLKNILLLLASDEDEDDDLPTESDEDYVEMITMTSAFESISNNETNSYNNNNNLITYTRKAKLKPKKYLNKTVSNIDNLIENRLSRYNQQEFDINLSIHKKLISYLSNEFAKSEHYLNIISRTYKSKVSLSARSHLHIFLWFVSHKRISYRNVSKHFRISVSTVQSVLFRVARFIKDLGSDVIKWPTSEEKQTSSENFKAVTKIPGIIGIIANTFIETDGLDKNGQPKQLPVQAVCNEEFKFIHVYVGDLTMSEHSDILEKSKISEKLETLDDNECLVGATVYSDVPYIKIPLKSQFELSDDQKEYNKNIEFCTSQLDLCFERMKMQFKQLNPLKVKNEKLQLLMIKACFILYNLNLEFEEQTGLNEHNYFNNIKEELIVKSEDCE